MMQTELSVFRPENNPKYGNMDLEEKNSTDLKNIHLAQNILQNFWLYENV